MWMSLILNQLEFGHIFIGEHVKINHQQLFYTLGSILITKWDKEKLFLIKKASRFGYKVHKVFTRHHDNLFNKKHAKKPKYKTEKASSRYIINNRQIV